MAFFGQNLHEILIFISGVITGVFGSFLTVKIQKSNLAKRGSQVVDQSGAIAGRDIVGRNSSTKN